MAGKFSADTEDLEKFLERKLTAEETANQTSVFQLIQAGQNVPYNLDVETIEILNEDRIETGG
jgi:hypothetical protein